MNPIAAAMRRSRPWQRFARNRLAVCGALWLAGFLLGTAVLLPCSIAWHDHQAIEHNRLGPSWHNPIEYRSAAERQSADAPGGRLLEAIGPRLFRVGAVLGFDDLGRSLLYRCLLGGWISLTIGLFAALISVTLGVLWGASAALCGGRTDLLLMRIVDILYGLPYILLVILLKVALDAPLRQLLNSAAVANIVILFVAIGANSWLTMARVIRGQVLSLKTRPFIEAARTYGAGRLLVLRRHLLPNLVGPVVVYGSLIVPQAILSESFLSFLGIGIQRPVPTLGSLVAEGLHAVNPVVNNWWLIVFPCGLLSLTLVALNFLGDGLRDAFDPRSNS